MVLDTLNSETPNIKDLATEIPSEKPKKIDIISEISPEYRQKAFEILRQWSSTFSRYAESFIEEAFAYQTIFQDEFNSIPISDDQWEALSRNIKSIRFRSNNISGDLEYAAKLSVILPQKMKNAAYKIKIADDFDVIARLGIYTNNINSALQFAGNWKILSPDDVNESVYNDQDWDKIKNDLLKEKSNILDCGLALRYISPVKCDEIMSQYSEADIDSCISLIKRMGETENTISGIKYAANLKAALSKEVIVTDEGIKLIEKGQPLDSHLPPLPEKRNF